MDSKKLQEMIEDYVIYLRKSKSRSTINNVVCALDLFFSMNDVILNFKKIRKFYPEQKKIRGDKPYTTKQLQDVLKCCSKHLDLTAIVHFMASSGVRVGFAEELQIKHIGKFEKDGCKSVKVYADTKDEYHTFIHSESVSALNEWLDYRKKNGEKLTPDSWVFCMPRNHQKPMISTNINSKLSRMCKSIDRGLLVNGRFETSVTHGIRKRWNTIAKSNPDVNPNHIEKMFGHSTIPLDNRYHKPTIEVLFDEYQKIIPELVIDDSYRLRIQLDGKNKEIDNLKSKEDKIEMLERQLLEVREHLLHLGNL